MKKFISFLSRQGAVNSNVSIANNKNEPELISEKLADASDLVVEYKDGRIYRGGIKNSKREGSGTLILLSKSNNQSKLSLSPDCLSIWNELLKLNQYNFEWNKILISSTIEEDKKKAAEAILLNSSIVKDKIDFLYHNHIFWNNSDLKKL